ncbi:uncharacterized protein LOC144437722 [Glandiceps talaboti]
MGTEVASKQFVWLSWKVPALLLTTLAVCHGQRTSGESKHNLEGESLGIFIVCMVILVLFVVGGLLLFYCRRMRRKHAREALARGSLINNQVDTAEHDMPFSDSPPSYIKCVESGIITSTESFLHLIWGDSISLPDYETVIRARAAKDITTSDVVSVTVEEQVEELMSRLSPPVEPESMNGGNNEEGEEEEEEEDQCSKELLAEKNSPTDNESVMEAVGGDVAVVINVPTDDDENEEPMSAG